MIAKLNHKSGPSGSSVGYILGVMTEKDQLVRIVDYNGFALSRLMVAELESVPITGEGKKAHKKKVWQIANELSKVFDARAELADYRVIDPLEEYIVSFVNDERERLLRVPTAEERAEYGMPKLTDGETDDRTLEKIILDELLSRIGVHGIIEKRLRRKRDGTKYTVTETVERDAMYLAVGHDGTAHPHMHVLTARPDADGKVNDTRNEKRRIVAAIRKLSRKYNLSLKLEGYEVDMEKTNLGYATKLRIRDAVKDALLSAANHEELAEILSDVAVFPTWKVHAETGKEYGILFTGIDRNGKEHTWSGSQIDRSLSYDRIETVLARNLADRLAQKEANRIAAQQELARQQEEARRKAAEEERKQKEAEARRKAEIEKAKDTVAGYNSVIPPMWNGEVSMVTVRNKAYQLMEAVDEAKITVSTETKAKFGELRRTWKEFNSLNQERLSVKSYSEATKAIGGLLMLLNPILGLTVVFLAKMSNDIRQSKIKAQKKQLLARVESIRSDISHLQRRKAQLEIVKQERLQEYLDAKRMLTEYSEGLQTVDTNIDAIKAEILKNERIDKILKFTQSADAQFLLDKINGAFGTFEGHQHLVPGPLKQTLTGMRWELYTDGYTYGKEIDNPHAPAPVEYGKSYVDFSFNEKGQLIATIEADKTNHYTKGVSGIYNLDTGEGDVRERNYRGSKEEHDQKKKSTSQVSQNVEKKTKKTKGPSL